MTGQETYQLEKFINDSERAGLVDVIKIIVVIIKILLRHRRDM